MIRAILIPLASLLASAAVLLVGHGLQVTLLPLHANSIGWSTEWIGYTGSAYFLGFIVGCITIPKLVSFVGHIRVFAGLSSCAAASLLAMGIFENLPAWICGRFITGWALAGLYMVIESWLNERIPNKQRGSVLSIYSAITMVSICAGQLLIGTPVAIPQLLFMGAAIFLVLSTLPVSLVRATAPAPIPQVAFHPGKLFKVSAVSVVGAFMAGLVTGGFWALGPVFASSQGLPPEKVGIFMATAIFGGACFQLPIGRLSDRIDRRKVIIGVSIVGLSACILVPVVGQFRPTWMAYIIFLFGGTAFPLYSLLLAHANDTAKLSRIEISSSILMMNSGGSIVGPIVVSLLMLVTDSAMFIVSGVAFIGLIVWTLIRILAHEEERDHVEPFIDIPKTTHEAIELAQSSEAVTPGPALTDK